MTWSRRSMLAVAALALAAVPRAHAQGQAAKETAAVAMFKIITVKDEILVGLSADELDRIGGRDAGAVARALAERRELTVWRYAVRKHAEGDLEQAPLARVGLLANESLRVEPYASPLRIVPHE